MSFEDEDEAWEDDGLKDEPPFETWDLDVIVNMEDPPAEAFETSWLRAREILEEAGPESAILLLTVSMEGDDLASKVVLSSGYQQIPGSYIREILDTHLRAMSEETDRDEDAS